MSQHAEPISRQLTIMIGLTVVGFMAFGLALSFYRNVLFDQLLITLRGQNNELREQIDQGYRDLEYYRSAQYKDKYAKENLGKLNVGEKALIVLNTKANILEDQVIPTAILEQQEAAYLELLRQMPTIQHWQMYLFQREKIDTLKKSFFGDS